jgi:phosphoglycerate dehydrogenase-like enzyme
MIRVAVLDEYVRAAPSLPYWDRLKQRAAVDFFHDTPSSEDALVERLRPYEIVVPIRERTRFTAPLLARLPALKLLALAGRHTGQVDLAAAAGRGIVVTDTEGSSLGAAELTIGLILATTRRIPQDDSALRSGQWQTALGVELHGKTIGIVGLGKIGTRIAAFGGVLGMRVLAWGPTLTPERATAGGAEYVALDTLLRQSDVVTLHLRLSDRSRGVLGARELGLMKPTAFLINTARGPLVDEGALVSALRARRIAGAALDVYDVEPLPRDHPLLSLDNVVVTPHTGFVTREVYDLFFSQVVETIEQYLDGRRPTRVVT